MRRLLAQIGFRAVSRIDPFDGGPHWEARLDEITLVRAHRAGRLSPAPLAGEGADALVAIEPREGPDRFRAVRCPVRRAADGFRLPAAARRLLGAKPGDRLDLVPFD